MTLRPFPLPYCFLSPDPIDVVPSHSHDGASANETLVAEANPISLDPAVACR